MNGTSVKRGALIVLEGCDRSGKTTQCKKMVERLLELGLESKFLQFPDRSTASGKIIDSYLTKKEKLPDQAIHLLFSANRWESEPKIKKLINEGVTLIVDRYSYSGVAYSAAKPNVDFEWCRTPEIGLPKPDLVFLLQLSDNALSDRQGFGEEIYEKKSFQDDVYKNYMKLKDNRWKIIECNNKSIEDVHEELLPQVKDTINQAQNTPLDVLW